MAKSSIDIAESLARLSASTIFELRRVAAAASGAAAHAVVPCATFHSNHSCDGTGLRVNQALCSESGFCCNLQSRIRLAIPRRQCIPGSRNRPAVKSELLRHWVACRSELSILTILSPTLAKPSRDVRCSYEGERRPASEKRANFAETLALSCLHQRQAFVFRDRAIEGLAVVPPENDLFRSRFRDDGRGNLAGFFHVSQRGGGDATTTQGSYSHHHDEPCRPANGGRACSVGGHHQGGLDAVTRSLAIETT
jgi:hypothetical protein